MKTVGVSVGDFKFFFNDNGVSASHRDRFGIESICYRSEWRVVMHMPDSYLPYGFRSAYLKSFNLWQKSKNR